jgi:hypothetical protein
MMLNQGEKDELRARISSVERKLLYEIHTWCARPGFKSRPSPSLSKQELPSNFVKIDKSNTRKIMGPLISILVQQSIWAIL